jgi:hypothetical protein
MNRLPIEFAINRLNDIASNALLAAKFDLTYWGNKLTTHAFFEPEDPGCGFGGCFMGWAVHQQWFVPWGLKLGFDGEEETGSPLAPRVEHESADAFQPFVTMAPRGDTQGAIGAVALLFGIQKSTFEHIIYEEHYPMLPDDIGVIEVRNRLKALLELGESAFMDTIVAEQEAYELEHADHG